VDAGRIGGMFAGIDEDGGLLLAEASGHIAAIRSGDVALL